MKALVIALAVSVAAVGGVAVGILWERGNKEARMEDGVASEVRLLEKHRLTPSCDQVQASIHGKGEAKSLGAIILWRVLPDDGQLARVVVGDDLTVAYETTENPCKRPVQAP